MNKMHLKYPLIVEGKYDKITLSSVISSTVICTGGFSVFRSVDLRALLLRLSRRSPLLVLLDSDGGGRQIRSFLSELLPKDRLIQLYIPQIKGKERRKRAPGKAGTLGVEGMDAAFLRELLLPYAEGTREKKAGEPITKTDLYLDGLSGSAGSAERRERLALAYGLPRDMTANALLEAINLLSDKTEYRKKLDALSAERNEA